MQVRPTSESVTLRLARRVVALLAVVLFASPAAATVKIALDGEAAPGGNGNFVSFDKPHLTETGKLVFFAETDDSVPAGAGDPGCFFRYDIDGSNGTALLCVGTAVGLPGMDFWISFETSRMDVNQLGDLVFKGSYRDTGMADQESVFHLSSAGALTDLGLDAFGLPELSLNDSNEIAVANSIGLYLTSPSGPATRLLALGDPLPDDPAFEVNDIEAAIGPDGELAVVVKEESICCGSGPFDYVFYRYESGTFTRLAEEGAPVGPITGATHALPHITPGGRMFALLEGDPFNLLAVVEWDGAAWREIFSPAAPEIVLLTSGWFESGGLSRIAYITFNPGPLVMRCQIAGFPERTVPLNVGDSVPGGTVHQLIVPGSVSTSHWAIGARLNSGTGPLGVFVGRATKVPSLGSLAVAALALLLGAGGVRRLHRGASLR